MARGVPRPDSLPPGPVRELIHALHDLYRDAGLPSMRTISTEIRRRRLPDTVSHETIGQMLRGDSVPAWIKFESVVRYLSSAGVHGVNVESEVGRFHELWLAAVATQPASTPAKPSQDAIAGNLAALPALPKPSADLSGELPPRNVRFVGREPLVRTIHEILGTGAPILTVTGIGGVGKTQLVIEYLYRFRDHYDLVWWIPAEHPSQLRASLADLGNRLGLPRSEAAQHPSRQVMAALADSTMRWLLVFDNAGPPGSSLALLQRLGSGHVLLTSRDPDWGRYGSVLEIGVFERAKSVRLLRDRASIDDEDADRVADRLGDLPLAVAQVAWHLATGVPVARYLDDLDEQLKAILADDRTKAANYPATVPGFLNVAFGRLAETVPAAAQLLEIFAWLSAEPLSLTLLRRGRQGALTAPLREALRHASTLSSAVRELRRHGLVTVLDGEPVRIQVHHIFQRVLRDWLGDTQLARGRANIHAILAAANPGDPDDVRSWGHYEEVGPHVIAADLASAAEFEPRRVVLDHVRYLFRVGHYAESVTLGQKLIAANTTDGLSEADHHASVLARHYLANAERMLGNYDVARQMTLDALEYLEEHPEFEPPPDYLTDLDKNRAADLRISGQYAHALTVDEAALRQQLRNDVNDQDQIRTIRNNVAVNLRLLGRFNEAYDLDHEIVRQWVDARGPRDPRTLFARSNLARDLFGLGRYADTLTEVRTFLPAYRATVGAHHHGVLLAVRTEAMTLRKLGRLDEALWLAEQNRDDLMTWFGPDHEYTLAATISLINIRLALGDLGTATVEMPRLLDGCARLFGDEHPMTSAVLVNSAAVLRALGDVSAARRRDEEAALILNRILGAHHPYTLCAEHNLAVDLALLGDPAGALSKAGSVLPRSRATRGNTHPDTLACAANVFLSNVPSSSSNQELDDWENTLGPAHPHFRTAREGHWVECDIEPPPT